MLDQEKILNFIKVTGPTLPTKVAKNINTNTLLASAHLSDLVSQRKVKVSHLKIGGSPLYYLPGQEEQLYQFTAGNINPKNLDVLEKLKAKKVLKEEDLELLEKVALRSLKDFAVPLHVVHGEARELFWRWAFLNDEQTSEAVHALYHTLEENAKEEVVEKEPEVTVAQPQQVPTAAELKEQQEQQQVQEKGEDAKALLEETPAKQKAGENQKQESQVMLAKEERKPLLKKLKEKIDKKQKEDVFVPIVKEFLAKHEVTVEDHEVVRKNAEANLTIQLPSALGKTQYYCKAKKKKRCDDKDLSAAYMEAQIKKLPLLFLHTGEMHKKAQDMLDSGVFQNVIIKKIG